jgi:EAL domain-containing protein (putative c-di-GMP-specific phosphodiesterase class I)
MSVNLSAAQFKHPELGEGVADVLRRSGLDPRGLILEITESMVVDVGAAMATLGELKSLGVNIAVDDFGTEYSSLYYLKLFPVDFLKIAAPSSRVSVATQKTRAWSEPRSSSRMPLACKR